MQAKRGKGLPLALIATALAALVTDQLSKALIRIYLPEGESISLGGLMQLRQVRNPGTAFGLIQVKSWPLFLISILVFALLLFVLWKWGGPGSTLFQVGMGLIIGGAVGNIVDRIALGEVVDFIDFKIWPIFNIADMAIVIGVAITMIIVARESWKDKA